MKRMTQKPLILAYHMEDGVKAVFAAEMSRLGVEVRTVEPSQANAPLGLLAGVPGWKPGVPAPGAGEITETMIILCGLSDKKLDEVLLCLRRNQIRISLKAVLTDYNISWSGRQLQTELKRERASIRESGGRTR